MRRAAALLLIAGLGCGGPPAIDRITIDDASGQRQLALSFVYEGGRATGATLTSSVGVLTSWTMELDDRGRWTFLSNGFVALEQRFDDDLVVRRPTVAPPSGQDLSIEYRLDGDRIVQATGPFEATVSYDGDAAKVLAPLLQRDIARAGGTCGVGVVEERPVPVSIDYACAGDAVVLRSRPLPLDVRIDRVEDRPRFISLEPVGRLRRECQANRASIRISRSTSSRA